jgi:hypothetical protein
MVLFKCFILFRFGEIFRERTHTFSSFRLISFRAVAYRRFAIATSTSNVTGFTRLLSGCWRFAHLRSLSMGIQHNEQAARAPALTSHRACPARQSEEITGDTLREGQRQNDL